MHKICAAYCNKKQEEKFVHSHICTNIVDLLPSLDCLMSLWIKPVAVFDLRLRT